MTRVARILTLITIVYCSAPVFSRAEADTAKYKLRAVRKDSVRQRDLMDVFHSLMHSTSISSKNDVIGLKPVVSMMPAIGYSLQSRMAILVSGNMAFRLAENSRVSVINFSTSYNQNAQFTLPLIWNIWTKNNTYNLIGDLRFYAYPQSTFGLGSNSAITAHDPMNYNYFRFSESVMRHITGSLYLGAGYMVDDHWGISHQLPISGVVPAFENYNNATHTVSSGLTLTGIFDSRDYSVNPSKGFYAMYQLRENLATLGSNASWNSLILDVRKYIKFPASSDNVLALWSYDWVTLSGNPPYLDLPSTLWDNSTNAGRGYIQGRFRGAQMVYGEAEYRYHITRDGLLGGVLFANMESFSAAPGTHLQSVQPGYGPGLRIKLNKTSKTNIAMDYGFGRQGSRGLFVNVGELF
jgi:outer membrane protein assembly factor BamA